jgi:hypothetical protein
MNAPRAALCFLVGLMSSSCGVLVSPDESRLRVFTAGDAAATDLGAIDAGSSSDGAIPPTDTPREDIAVDLGDDAPTDRGAPQDLPPADDLPVPSDVPISSDVPVPSDAPVPSDVPAVDVPAPMDVGCATGLALCGVACFDLGSDLRHCGSCDLACPADRVCSAGRCQCPSTTTENSRGRCVATQVDPENCGRLGHQCADFEACQAGVCVCRPGLTRAGSQCVDTQSDHSHCGRVDNRCSDTMICVAGVCTGRGNCRSPQTLCGRDCVDLSRSPLNCGDCGEVCGRTDVCIGGSCRYTRPEPGCTTCPCAPCAADRQLCCTSPAAGGFALCVDASRCP